MGMGIAHEPIDFASVDGKGVTIVILLVSPINKTGPHIQALAKISRLMNIEEFRDAVERATTPEELHHAIETYENHGAE